MGQLIWPPYEDFRDNTETWQNFERLLKRQQRYQTVIPVIGLVLFLVGLALWVLAFGGSDALL